MRDFSTQISFFCFLMSFMPTGARGLDQSHHSFSSKEIYFCMSAATTYYIKRLSAKTTHCLVSLRSHNQPGHYSLQGALFFDSLEKRTNYQNSAMRLIDWIKIYKTG